MGLRGESTARLGVRVGSWVSVTVSFSFRLTDDTPAPGQGLVVCCNGGWERACLVPWEKGGCDLPTRAQDATHQTPIVECVIQFQTDPGPESAGPAGPSHSDVPPRPQLWLPSRPARVHISYTQLRSRHSLQRPLLRRRCHARARGSAYCSVGSRHRSERRLESASSLRRHLEKPIAPSRCCRQPS